MEYKMNRKKMNELTDELERILTISLRKKGLSANDADAVMAKFVNEHGFPDEEFLKMYEDSEIPKELTAALLQSLFQFTGRWLDKNKPCHVFRSMFGSGDVRRAQTIPDDRYPTMPDEDDVAYGARYRSNP